MRNLVAASLALVFSAGLALAQDPEKKEGTVNMVDVERGKMLVALPFNDGIKIVEYDLKDIKFLDEKVNPSGGLKNDVFVIEQPPGVPVNISFTKDGE